MGVNFELGPEDPCCRLRCGFLSNRASLQERDIQATLGEAKSGTTTHDATADDEGALG